MKIRKSSVRIVGMLLASVLLIASCKNQKKVSELSDPDQDKVESSVDPGEGRPDQIVDETEEEERIPTREPSRVKRLESYFESISSSGTTAANKSIEEALTRFSSPEAPVLVVIYSGDGSTDYDEPTTIEKYLHYLKDTGNYNTTVEEMVVDDAGRIKELVLRKQK